MKREEYQEAAMRTLSPHYYIDRVPIDVLHAIAGLITESGELMDHLKRVIFYGSEYDPVNLAEEAGDVEWYLALLRSALGITQEETQIANIRKLSKRYPEKFDDVLALNRDLDEERNQLKSDTKNTTKGIIYLASPYTSNNSNPEDKKSTEHLRFSTTARIAGELINKGHIIYSPITHNHPMKIRTDLPGDWEFWKSFDEIMIKACSELWVLMLYGWNVSKGVTAEIEIAKSLRMPIKFIDPDTLEWFGFIEFSD